MSKKTRYWTSSMVFLRDTIFKGYLVNKAPLRIGSGRGDRLGSLVDLPTLYVSYAGIDIPYIPGSSLKGVFRSCAESIATAKGLEVCNGLARSTCMDRRKYNDSNLGDYVEREMKRGHPDEAMKAFWEKACLICKVFGSPSYSGKATFFDGYPLNEKAEPIPHSTGVRTGISIDRRMGAVHQRALYTVQYVEPEAKFRFSIRCQNLPNYVLGLLSYVLELVDTGNVKVGGFKSRGFGIMKMEDLAFMWRDCDVEKKSGDLVLRSFRDFGDEADEEIELGDLASMEDSWGVVKGNAIWEALAKLRGLWERAAIKG